MPHTSVTVFLPAGQEQDGRYVGAGILVDPRLVVLTGPFPTPPLVVDQKVRVHLHAPGVSPQLARGTALPTAYPGLVLIQFAQPVATHLPVEQLSKRFATATSPDAVATLLRDHLQRRLPDAVTTVDAAGHRTATSGGKPWWCWISSNGPGCR